ncbi:MAG: TadE/TadG family type IV pilus assembly protein [Anaerolineales bacterium]
MPSRTVGIIRRSRGLRFREAGFSFPGFPARGFRKIQSGQASLEVLIVLMILIPLIFGAIELSRGVAVKSSLDSGVGLAVRALSVDPSNWSWAAVAVSNTVAQNVFGSAGLDNFTFYAYDSSGTQLDQTQFAALTYGAGFYIEASVRYSPDIPLLSLSPITIRARHYGIIERIE